MLTQYLFPFFVLKNEKVGERIFSAEKGLDLLRGERLWSWINRRCKWLPQPISSEFKSIKK